MTKNYNPYTVPEGFFEDSAKQIVQLHGKRSRAFKYAFLSAAVAAVLLVIPILVGQQPVEPEPAAQESQVNNLALMYDCDIFLQVNF